MKIIQTLIIFFILTGSIFAEQNEEQFSFTYSNAINEIDTLKHLHKYNSNFGTVYNVNSKRIGVYVNALRISDYTESKRIRDLILYFATLNAANKIVEGADNGISDISRVHDSIEDAINKVDLFKKIAEQTVNLVKLYRGDGVWHGGKTFVDNWLLIAETSLQCSIPRELSTVEQLNGSMTIRTDYQETVCWVISSPGFGAIKDILYETLDVAFDKGFGAILRNPDIPAKVAAESAAKIIGSVFFVADMTLKGADIANNVIGAIKISSENRRKNIALMIQDFSSQFYYYDQNINILKEAVLTRSKKYTGIDDLQINNFTELFGYFIILRSKTEYGCFSNAKEKISLSNGCQSSSLLSNIDFSLIGQAADVMAEIINLYGDGGNFVYKLKPKVGQGIKTYDISYSTKFEMLYFALPPEFVFPGKGLNGSLRVIINPNAYPVSGSCSIPSKVVLGTSEEYEVVNNTSKLKKLHHIPNVQIKCFVNLKGGAQLSKVLTIKDSYIEEVFPDIESLGHWSLKYIGPMLSNGTLKGYSDGKFYPDEGVSVGEFLKIVSREFYPRDSRAYLVTKSSDKSLYKYIEFLDEQKNIDILPLKTDGERLGHTIFRSNINDGATRNYVAKIINNILTDIKASRITELTSSESCIFDRLGWSVCSKNLKGLNIVNGEYIDGNYQYNPNQIVKRQEIAKIIINAKKVAGFLKNGRYPVSCSNIPQYPIAGCGK